MKKKEEKKKSNLYLIIIIIILIILLFLSLETKDETSEKVECFNNAMVDIHGYLVDCGLGYWERDNVNAMEDSIDCYSRATSRIPGKRAGCNYRI